MEEKEREHQAKRETREQAKRGPKVRDGVGNSEKQGTVEILEREARRADIRGFVGGAARWGHKAAECPHAVQWVEEDPVDDDQADVGGVWIVGGVDAYNEETEKAINGIESGCGQQCCGYCGGADAYNETEKAINGIEDGCGQRRYG